MSFTPLVNIEGTKPHTYASERMGTHGNARNHHRTDYSKPKKDKRGCEFCPLDKLKGLNKVFGKVRGRDIFIWAQSPGQVENKKKKELKGPAGKFLWQELKRVGITRDMCDIQNVVRCMPADRLKYTWPPFKMRSPTKEEIKCCSIYNDKAIEKSKAKLNLVFGQVAGVSLLGKELKKDQRIFFSDKLNGWVVYLDHPAYFIRQGFKAGVDKDPTESLKRFRMDLKKAKELLKKGSFDRYGFLKEQNYIGVTHSKQSNEITKKLKRKALKEGKRLVVDMEEGKVNERGKPDEKGESVPLACGVAYKPGTSYTFALRHPDARISERAYQTNLRNLQNILSNPAIKIAFQYGVSDTDAVRRLLHTDVQGYDYDTLLAEYFKDPDAKAYGLTAIANRSYPDFTDYKNIEGPDGFTPAFLEFLENKDKKGKLTLAQKVALGRSKNGINLARLPWNKLVLYNGADCHITALSERDTQKFVNPPLMQVYIDASFVLYRMQRSRKCQPIFDYEWHRKVNKYYKLQIKLIKKRLRKIAGKYAYITKLNKKTGKMVTKKKKFNPSSPEHILWLIYEKLGYKMAKEDSENKKKKRHSEDGEVKNNTKAGTLMRIGLKHPKALLVVKYRELDKAKGTYVDGYKKCADLNEGYLRTNWKTTGTSTGRLSSGRTKDKSNDAVVNFQNVHGDPFIKCLLISDRRWRKLFKYWLKHGSFNKRNWRRFQNLYVDLGFDFSQNELRQLAEESGDEELIKMFSSTETWYCDPKKGGCGKEHSPDPHVEVGHAITGWAKEKIAHDDRVRKLIKNMQFGLVYGLAGEGLYRFVIAFGVKTTLKEINKYHKAYFKRFKGVKKLQERYRAFAEKHHYVVNQFGFRRNLKVAMQQEMGNEYEGAYWGNQAINTPIQGAAHQLLMMVVAALHRYPKKYKLLQNPNKEIHDAMYFRIKLKYLFEAIKKGLELMLQEPVRIVERDFKLKKRVPLSAKPKAGFRFGVETEDIGKNEWEFLNNWCKANQELENTFKTQYAKLN